MPIIQRDANNNTVSIKTLNDINAGDPLPVQIAQTLSATDSIVQANIGGTNSTPATTPTNNTGLNGVLKGLWKDISDRFLSLVGTTADTPSATGSLMARLGQIAANAGTGGGGSGGSTDVTGIETRLGAVDETAAAADGASSGLNGLVKRYLARFTIFLGILGTTSDTASATGSLMARLGAIASSGGGSGGASFVEVATTTPVAVGTTATDVLLIDTSGWRFLGIEIHNQGAVALDNLYLSVRFHSAGDWLRVTYSESDFSTNVCKNSGNMGLDIINTSNFGGFGASISALPAYNQAWIQMQLRGFSGVKITATVATGTTPVSIKAYLH